TFHGVLNATHSCDLALSGLRSNCHGLSCGELILISIGELATSGLSSEPLQPLDTSSTGPCVRVVMMANSSKSIRRKRRSRDSQPDWFASRLQLHCRASWIRSLIHRTSGERKRCEDASH